MKINKAFSDGLEALIKKVTGEGFKVETFQTTENRNVAVRIYAAYEDVVRSNLSHEAASVSSDLRTLFALFDEAVKGTEAYKNLMEEKDIALKECKDLRNEVNRLKEFETYYNMQFQMQHGKQKPRNPGEGVPK